jgi:A/G-specific adenine glycosylase
MLQQTRVGAALPYYKRFMKRFPNIAALAASSETDIMEHWAGLGYYQRARNLHRAARQMMDRFGGRFPSDLEQIRRLPGIGPYTAGAIFSIAFHQPEPVVDGNVRRVMLRLHDIAKAP